MIKSCAARLANSNLKVSPSTGPVDPTGQARGKRMQAELPACD
jgi:hypothetical protein